MKKRPIQLSLFDLPEAEQTTLPASSRALLPSLQSSQRDEFSKSEEINEVIAPTTLTQNLLPSYSRQEKKIQKLIDETNFQALVSWLKEQLQSHYTLPLEIRNIHGRTRYVSLKKEGDFMMLRIHRKFAQAPDFILHALVNWLKGPRKKPPKLIEQYIAELTTLAARAQRNTNPDFTLLTKGKFFDLKKLYDAVNEEWFGGVCNVSIGWGRSGPLNARSRHLGSYSAPFHRILIHPLLDNESIPEFVIRFVIFHELLHSRQPPGIKNPHDMAFRIVERTHSDYLRMKQWEKDFFGKATF